ncbi:plastid/chloroplast ribosomal protein S10 [Volvox carteri f. nagariensis]|uniref:Plastid/chloroplast ribosomal protein S10 n=1 Tax=Volvox carteri f. nagariensis TaxID=3068 RepID=D8UEZ1_VOLCA|nr:plastid/chloroplast ribosomal protein S10 [Volvox carteri f. nagariensis]EFJ41678.1 plastid/chloroplast ribosomal protein S10 [Volvox carteri f. nagariensis]|eukprot:XP_002957180.1 plastid/chloroplast ribosomal protein S10 [Volvox carteri f. nagariensis]
MQALASRCSRAQPFTTSRPMVARLQSGAIARRAERPSQFLIANAVVSDTGAVDVEQYEDELDLPMTAGTPLAPASDKVRLRIRMRSYEVKLLEDCIAQIQTVADATGAAFKGPVMLPTKKRVYCVLRSPHVNKDAREHFEIRTHHRLVDLKNLSAETVSMMMQWVPPSGVEVECSIA